MEKNAEPKKSAKELMMEQAEQRLHAMELQAQEERDEEERRKKLRRRLEAVFLAYAQMAKQQEEADLQQQRHEEWLKKEFFREHLRYSYQNNQSMMQQVNNHEQAVSDFFIKDEPPQETEQREALLKETNISSDEFASLALSSCADIKNFSRDAEAVFHGKQPSENLMQKRPEGKAAAMAALHGLQSGSTEKMEELLKKGLVSACYEFSNAGQPVNAMHWARHANSILSIISSHPVLFKGGADKKLVEMATGVASMGKIMENGYEALMEIQKSKMEGIPLSPEREQLLNAKVLLMQQVDTKRALDQYKSFFAEGYHPKKGLPPERLEAFLTSIQNSKTMRDLSKLKPDERLFCLSDPESRTTLANNLSKEKVLHVPAAAKKLSPEPPAAQMQSFR